MRRLLCILGLHRWRDITDPDVSVYVWQERCDHCNRQRSGWTFY